MIRSNWKSAASKTEDVARSDKDLPLSTPHRLVKYLKPKSLFPLTPPDQINTVCSFSGHQIRGFFSSIMQDKYLNMVMRIRCSKI